jgi:hypothetical protein
MFRSYRPTQSGTWSLRLPGPLEIQSQGQP